MYCRLGCLILLVLSAAAQAADPASVTVPLRLDKGVIFFDATVDGKGPYAFILDPGAEGAVSGDTLRKLGLPVTERAELKIAIGKAAIGKVSLQMIDGDGSDLDPKHDPAGPPIAGALGPEILKQFALRLDYAHATLTLTPLATFKYQGRGQALPVVFHDVIPLITASADGVSGLFAYDVRAPGKLMLFHPFLESHGFLSRYGVAPDGDHPAVIGVLHRLELAGVTLADQPATFAGYTTGKFAAADEAGILGHDVLSQFVTTVDYRDKLIYFEAPTPPG
ncbi:MAG TPA: hypothetical protein VLG68_10130 [Gammaproteobacteria bacterium]|nr:hypothetical protein [Gammaproteobacteria bacterium]